MVHRYFLHDRVTYRETSVLKQNTLESVLTAYSSSHNSMLHLLTSVPHSLACIPVHSNKCPPAAPAFGISTNTMTHTDSAPCANLSDKPVADPSVFNWLSLLWAGISSSLGATYWRCLTKLRSADSPRMSCANQSYRWGGGGGGSSEGGSQLH